MKKGFTLIELLGTIVILGMIALIATPPIVNLVKKSDQKISEDNIKLIYKAGMDYVNEFENKYKIVTGETICLSIKELVDNGNLKESLVKQQNIDVNKSIQFTIANNMKFTYELKLYDTVCSNTQINTIYHAGDVIYYNPETNKKCTEGQAISTTGTKKGCMRWNVIAMHDDETKQKIDIMLDHNTTSTVAWGSSEQMTYATEALNNDTTSWTTGLNPRLIDGYEVSSIAQKSWSGSGSSISFPEVTWLYQNTVPFNQDGPNGYWTTSVSAKWGHAWYVIYDGSLDDYDDAEMANAYGIRPVITIQKSVID